MEIIVLDNGLSGRGEHSYHLLCEVCKALSQRGIAYRVFGAKEMDSAIIDDIGALPHFSRSLYWFYKRIFRPLHELLPLAWGRIRDFADQSTYSEERIWRLLNNAYQRDLEKLPADVWNPENLVVIPAISQNQLTGLVRFLLTLPQETMPRIVCQLMFPPSWTPWGRKGRFGETYYREAFQLAGRLINRSLFFTTENDALAEIYRREFEIETTLLPIPLSFKGLPQAEREKVRLGFFGYSKREKGFHLLPKAIELCRAKQLPIDFVVQIQHSNWEKETIETEKQLRRIPGLEFIEGTMNSADYAEKTNAVDATLLPYDPQRFGLRGSGVLTEAIAAGRPIIAAKGIYAATKIEKGEAAGEIFAPYDSAALAAAIERLLPKLAEHKARARQRADEYALRHNGNAYANVLLRFAGGEAKKDDAIIRAS